jgi:uncharacterized protein involved in exopolysaccharide biosynthesis
VQSHQELEYLSQEPDNSFESNTTCQERAEISLVELFRILSRRKATIARAVIISAAIAAGIALLLPAKYTAEAVIFTPQRSQPSLSALAQLTSSGSAGGALSSLGVLSELGLRSPADLYVGILESRTIADSLITKFNLKEVYKDDEFYTARKQLKHNTTIKAGRDTLIHVRVDDRDPHRAAQLANAYVDELADQNSRVALTEASQRRLFFETQMAKEKDLLSDAEIALRNTQQSTGLVAPTGQAEGLIRAVSQLHGEILSREAQVEAMKAYATDDNPRLQIAKREVEALRGELDKLERGNHIPGTAEVAAGQLPEAGLEYLRKYRDLKYHETLFEVLAKQYEAARLDEAKSAPMVQVIDRAVPPERKSWPPRAILTVAAAVLAGFVSAFWILLRERPQLGRT